MKLCKGHPKSSSTVLSAYDFLSVSPSYTICETMLLVYEQQSMTEINI